MISESLDHNLLVREAGARTKGLVFFHVGIQDPEEHEVSSAEVGIVVGYRAHMGATFENVVAWPSASRPLRP